uniref:Uncharacterized protein n=1 Tax=Cannabis sativa TaxID=3483 RepID=A0A803PU09_CANSA
MDERNLIMNLLNGLGPEYDPVVVHVTNLVDNLSFELIQSLLFPHESRLEQHYIVHDSSPKIMANLTTSSPRFASSLPNSRSTGVNRCGYGYNQSSRPLGRFDKAFIPPKSGANKHVATGMENLDYEIPYHGQDTLAVGDGKKLHISHIGYLCESSTGRIYVTRNVQFNEEEFPALAVQSPTQVTTPTHNTNSSLSFFTSPIPQTTNASYPFATEEHITVATSQQMSDLPSAAPSDSPSGFPTTELVTNMPLPTTLTSKTTNPSQTVIPANISSPQQYPTNSPTHQDPLYPSHHPQIVTL